MNKEFIPYEQALELKELGFDEPCLAFYNGKFLDSTNYDFDSGECRDIGQCVKTPTYSQCFRWFREIHNIVFYLNMVDINLYYYVIETEPFLHFNTYEEAELACLCKLIEIIKNK